MVYICMESMECLNQDVQNKKQKVWHILCIVGRDDQITTHAKLLDIMYNSYGFNANPIDTIN